MSTVRLATTAAISLVLFALLGLVVAHGSSPYGFEDPAINLFVRRSAIATWSDVAHALGTPALVVVLVVCLGIGIAKGVALRVVLYGLLAIGAIMLSDYIAKPLIDRTYYGELTFPSGHVTSASATSLAMCLALFPVLEKWGRAAAALLGLAWVGLTSVAVVAGQWHTPVDVIGAVLFAVGIVTAGAAVLESPTVSRSILAAAQRSPGTEFEQRGTRPNVEELLGQAEDAVGVTQAQGVDQEKG